MYFLIIYALLLVCFFFFFFHSNKDNLMKSYFFIFESISPYGFFRIQNEQPTLVPFLKSIENSIFRGVIVYLESYDQTEKLLFEFVKSHPYFQIFKYPFLVKRKNRTRIEERIDFFYNFVLSKIPSFSWFLKLDADNIYSSKSLFEIFRIPIKDNDMVCIPYLNIYCNTSNQIPYLIFNGNKTVYNVCDHFMLKKFNLYFELGSKTNDQSCEVLRMKEGRNKIYVSIQALHFPIQKKHRNYMIGKAKIANIIIDNKVSPKFDNIHCPKILCNYQNIYSTCQQISYFS
ncbi:beta-1,4-N-acetylgalactosaminyltransferase [Tritrichomonas foetus]|uniref:Beta-1,4-N-acetylgalactosaminyltransferase n=1 Tax=Tritrichomonas foetus TaxID=1144522 RepID=A0A1J4L1X5_9EUKA|nr:beta-1,4-N-acetylgalactosaminyltransferase [Tritrichomonas foetus]|eukprot:OHT15972.1 beta-1,4-N-acetylgalactosaminyltransferase [Tritrichomonas foetus]